MNDTRRIKGWCSRLSVRRASRLSWLSLLILVLILMPASCALPEVQVFPTLESDGHSVPGPTKQSEATQPSDDLPGDQVSLLVAVPYGADAAELLRLLFLARTSGQLPAVENQLIGQYVQASDLALYDGPLRIDLQTVSASAGASAAQISVWQATAQMPDVLYLREAVRTPGLDQLLDLHERVYDAMLLSGGHIFGEILAGMQVNQTLYGIPYLGSTPLVYYNQKLLDQYLGEPPLLNQTWDEWLNMLTQLQKRISQTGHGATWTDLVTYGENTQERNDHLQQTVFLLENPVDFLPFIPASMTLDSGWAMWQGRSFDFADPAFKMSADWLRLQVQKGYSPWHLTYQDRLTALKLDSARTDSRTLFWVGDSTDLSAWHQQSDLVVSEILMPAGFTEFPASGAPALTHADQQWLMQRLPVEIRSLAISKTSRQPELAVAFAAFLALDPDALLLQSRFQLYEGLFPVVQNQAVWEAMVGRQPFGHILLTIKERMPYAYCSGRQLLASWDATINQVYRQLGARYLSMTDPSGLTPLLEDISRAVPRILAEE